VKTPSGFKDAYQQHVEGITELARDAVHGGNLPESLGLVLSEMVGSANWSGMHPGLSHGPA
jgi:hypothetical protein